MTKINKKKIFKTDIKNFCDKEIMKLITNEKIKFISK